MLATVLRRYEMRNCGRSSAIAPDGIHPSTTSSSCWSSRPHVLNPRRYMGGRRAVALEVTDVTVQLRRSTRRGAAAQMGVVERTRFLRYLSVGALSAGLDLGILVLAREAAGLSLGVATTIAFWTALAVNFSLNRVWVFRTGGSISRSFLRYMIIVAYNYVLTMVIVLGATSLGIAYPIGKVMAIGAVAVWTFLLYQRWVFR
jgi:putative flippase GtrA